MVVVVFLGLRASGEEGEGSQIAPTAPPLLYFILSQRWAGGRASGRKEGRPSWAGGEVPGTCTFAGVLSPALRSCCAQDGDGAEDKDQRTTVSARPAAAFVSQTPEATFSATGKPKSVRLGPDRTLSPTSPLHSGSQSSQPTVPLLQGGKRGLTSARNPVASLVLFLQWAVPPLS